MKKLLGVLALSVAIPVLNAGVYDFNTLHHDGTGKGAAPITHDSALGDRDSHKGIGPNLVGGDGSLPLGVPTPEPGFYGLMALGFSALAIFQVRKRRQM